MLESYLCLKVYAGYVVETCANSAYQRKIDVVMSKPRSSESLDISILELCGQIGGTLLCSSYCELFLLPFPSCTFIFLFVFVLFIGFSNTLRTKCPLSLGVGLCLFVVCLICLD